MKKNLGGEENALTFGENASQLPGKRGKIYYSGIL